MKKALFILSVIVLVAFNANAKSVKYEGVLSPETFIKWNFKVIGLDQRGLVHIDFTSPEGEIKVVQTIFQKNLLIAYRYKFHGEMYVIVFDPAWGYKQVYPKKIDVWKASGECAFKHSPTKLFIKRCAWTY